MSVVQPHEACSPATQSMEPPNQDPSTEAQGGGHQQAWGCCAHQRHFVIAIDMLIIYR